MGTTLPPDRSGKKKAHQKSVGSKCKITFAALPFIHEGYAFHFRRVLGLLNHQLPLRDSAGLSCDSGIAQPPVFPHCVLCIRAISTPKMIGILFG